VATRPESILRKGLRARTRLQLSLPRMERYLDSFPCFPPRRALEKSLLDPAVAYDGEPLFATTQTRASTLSRGSRPGPTHLPAGDILTKLDRMSMANSLGSTGPPPRPPPGEFAGAFPFRCGAREQTKYL